MDFGLFTTWNAVYVGDKVPWDPDYRGGKLLEAAAYAQNWKEVQAVEDMGWDYLWLGGGHFSTQGAWTRSPSCCLLLLPAAPNGSRLGPPSTAPYSQQPGDKAPAGATP